eukprot:gene2554-73_t
MSGKATIVGVTALLGFHVQGVPMPTPVQVAYQRQEIVALTHFNMATFFKDGDPACDSGNWQESQKPSSFAPTNLNISNWIESYKGYGYHVGGQGGIGVDVVGEYAKAMRAAGLPHSYYYSLKDSFYLNAARVWPALYQVPTTQIGDNVKPPNTALPGQVAVTQDQFESISVAAVTELWGRYGNLAEICDHIKDRIVPLLQKLQPGAITMGAGIDNDPNEVHSFLHPAALHSCDRAAPRPLPWAFLWALGLLMHLRPVGKPQVDWVGTESGMPKYPVWSTGCAAPGAGSGGQSPKDAKAFCPKCGDCTLQAPDHWFWMPNTPTKSLDTLIHMYHGTVGNNCVMELDFAIDRTGNVDPAHAARYREFGGLIRSCYGSALASSPWTMGLSVTLAVDPPASIDRVALMEDISRGQRVTEWSVEAQAPGSSTWAPFTSGSAIGHKHISIAGSASKVAQLRLTVSDGVELPANLTMLAYAPCASQ